MKLVWGVGGWQTGHDGEAHLAPEGHTTSSVICCPDPMFHWVCGGGCIVPGE
jgi:hypothetical protein